MACPFKQLFILLLGSAVLALLRLPKWPLKIGAALSALLLLYLLRS